MRTHCDGGWQGHGLTPEEMAFCDRFVYIAHYGAGTASLNVTVATSIVLHHFGLWAGFEETVRAGVGGVGWGVGGG